MKKFICFFTVFIFAPEKMEFGSMNFDSVQKIDNLGNVSYAWFYPLNKEPSFKFLNTSNRSSISNGSSDHNLTESHKSLCDSPKSSCEVSNESVTGCQSISFDNLAKFCEINSTSESEKDDDLALAELESHTENNSENSSFSNDSNTFNRSVSSLKGSFSDLEGKTENVFSDSEDDFSLRSISYVDPLDLSDKEKQTENIFIEIHNLFEEILNEFLQNDKDAKATNVFNVIYVTNGNMKSKNHNKKNEDPLYYRSVNLANSSLNIRKAHQNKLKKLIDSRKNQK